MKLLFKTAIILFTLIAQCIFSQNSVVHFGLVYPVSSNGTKAPSYTNSFSVHAIAGISKNENIIIISGVSSIIKENANGVQISGVSNHIGNNGNGIAIAGVLNSVKNNYSGILISGVINKTKKVNGVQIAGLINISEDSKYPIAILNFIKNGEHYFSAKYDYLGNYGLSFNSGNITYGILGINYNQKIDSFLYEAGLGFKIKLSEKFLIRNEVSLKSKLDKSFNENVRIARFTPSGNIKIGEKLEIFAAPTLDYIETKNLNYTELFSKNNLWEKKNKQLQLGYLVGVNFFL